MSPIHCAGNCDDWSAEHCSARTRCKLAERCSALRPAFRVFDRDVKNHVELFRPENVPLETDEAKLCQQYQKLSGSLTVNFRGEEKTLVQMGRYLEEPDRALRQEAWETRGQRAVCRRPTSSTTFLTDKSNCAANREERRL